MRVAFLSLWAERGQAYVTRTMRKAIENRAETFVLARTGAVYGKPLEPLDTGIWDVPNLWGIGDYYIEPRELAQWCLENDIDVLITNEEYVYQLQTTPKHEAWEQISAVQAVGTRVFGYLDYLKLDDVWKSGLALYDGIFCSSKRSYNLVKDFCDAHYIGWAVDTGLFKPQGTPEYDFIVNAGWLGLPDAQGRTRKGTEEAIKAFAALRPNYPDATMLLHMQEAPVDFKQVPGITIDKRTLPAPGLYHKANCLVFPTRMEGLGLPWAEALSCGCPVITTDIPPANEFIQHDKTGLLCEWEGESTRDDGLVFPYCYIKQESLIENMEKALDYSWRARARDNARAYAEEHLSLEKLGNRVMEAL